MEQRTPAADDSGSRRAVRGETLLRAGDVLVDRGIMHSWRNDGDQPCRIVNVLCPALPLGKGATVSGEI